MNEKMIAIPEWILRDAIETLRLNYNMMEEYESCLKRKTVKSYNYLNAHLHGKATEDEINDISLHYIMAKLRNYD